MLKNRKMDHLGLFTKDIDSTVQWYCEVLGFELYGSFVTPDGTVCKFIRNQTGVAYELIYPSDKEKAVFDGKVDHVAFASEDIQADYDYCMKNGYRCTTEGIQTLNDFWENGSSYFKIATTTGEEIEFCQLL